MDCIWLIPLLPGLGAAVNGLFGIRFFSKRTAGLVACTTMARGARRCRCAPSGSCSGCRPRPASTPSRVADVDPADPARSSRTARSAASQVPWAFRLDPLSGMMILVVTGIGFLIHVYSIGYMHDEPRGGYARYFAYLNLFCFFMLMLVLGDNFLVMFVGWEGVGLCSYLLIGYWYEKKSASDAGKKAFIVNRIGDWGFLLGMFLVFFTFGTLDFRAVAERGRRDAGRDAPRFGVLSLIRLLLFVGATGKSAQIPLYVWLPDAMEGPTPVSALIHAATMVTAGVYMVGRNAVLFSHAPMTMEIVADRRRADGADGRHDRPRAERHQAGAGVLDRVAARLHVPGDGRGRVRRRRVPPDDARLLQGAALPRQRRGHPRHGRASRTCARWAA